MEESHQVGFLKARKRSKCSGMFGVCTCTLDVIKGQLRWIIPDVIIHFTDHGFSLRHVRSAGASSSPADNKNHSMLHAGPHGSFILSLTFLFLSLTFRYRSRSTQTWRRRRMPCSMLRSWSCSSSTCCVWPSLARCRMWRYGPQPLLIIPV